MRASSGYAEMFEWLDGNPNKEDRAGISVVLTGNRVRPASTGEAPLGVVGGDNTSVDLICGNSAREWRGQHKRDEYGRLMWEKQEMIEWVTTGYRHWYERDRIPEGIVPPDDAIIHDHYPDGRPMFREILTDEYKAGNPHSGPYLPRSERPEWAIVVLLGRVIVRAGQPTNMNWANLGNNEWLIK